MRMFLFGLPLALMACASPDTVPMSAASAQSGAANQFADVDVAGIAKCVRANATSGELRLLDAGGEIAQSATRAILQRPETGDCIVAASADVGLERAG